MDKSMFVDYLILYILPNKKRNGNERWQSTRKNPAFLPVTDGFQQKWDAILFNTERNLVELLLVQKKHQPYKKQLSIKRREKKTG